MDVSALQSMIGTLTAETVGKATAVQSGTNTTAVQTNEAKDTYQSKLSQIAAKYDVKHMSAKQVTDMAQELRDKGLISTPDFLGMALLPYLMDGSDAGASAAMTADGTVDLSKYWKIVSVTPSDAEAGLKLFNILISDRKEKADSGKTATSTQSTVNVQAAASSYADAISKSTADPQSVINVLEALSLHSQNVSSSSGKV